MPMHLSRRKGFTLAEVAIAAVIIAIMAAVTAPSLVSFIDKERAQTTADKLSAIATGLAGFESAIHTGSASTNNAYPGRISYLTNAITTAQFTTCHTAFTATSTAQWSTSGPFLTFYIPVGGLNTPLGIIQDSVIRVPSSGGPAASPGTVALHMTGVDANDAAMLDQVVDGGDGGSAGVVQYTITGTTADVRYLVPVLGKC